MLNRRTMLMIALGQSSSESSSVSNLGTYKVTASSLNVRKGAGISYTSVGTISKGTTWTVYGKSSDGNWYKILYNGAYYWVSASYMERVETTDTSTLNKYKVSTTYGGDLNVRKSASYSSDSIGSIANGTTWIVYDISSDKAWYKILYNGVYGWVYYRYMTKV